jgi:hypothetical protein
MRILKAMTVIGCCTATAGAGSSNPVWMAPEDLAATFGGRSIAGEYENGDTFEETYAEDGSISYRDVRRASAGKWSIRAGTLCTIYDADPSGGCYRVRRASENCFEFHFIARTEEQVETTPGKPDWTARGWLSNQPKTCVDGESV